MSFRKKRYLVYSILTIFIMVLPFVTINENHIIFLSFDKLQFHILGIAFNVNEFYVMPFLLIFLFIGIFALTSIFGRIIFVTFASLALRITSSISLRNSSEY